MTRRRTEEDEILDAWRRAKPVKVRVRRDPTSVLSIRVPQATLKELSERGAAEGKPASEYARDLIERGLASGRTGTPSELGRLFTRWLREYQEQHSSRTKSRRST